ncbi:MAG TPA: energy transducer TonB [Ginsengibacter sp.]
MDANNILTANLLDILFEGKNKAYGAYELRKTYNKRISFSLIITITIIGILLIVSAITRSSSTTDGNAIPDTGTLVVQPPPPPEPPPPPRPILPPPPVATIAYVKPLIVKDNQVIKPPPDIQQIINATIDVKTTVGPKDDGGFIAPPIDITGSQVIAQPVKKQNPDSIFIKVEVDATFPGGAGAWTKYVSKAVQGNIDEFSETDYGTCMVKFIVDKTGKVSHVEATTMKNTKLAEIATNAIRKGPNWIPAQQNGVYVNAYRFQPVTFTNPD